MDKKLEGSHLLNAIRRTARGEILYDEEQIKQAREWKEEVSTKWESLSRREREVLLLLTEGQDNHAIAVSLGISINTVEKHLKNLYNKLGVTSRTEAIHWWVEKVRNSVIEIEHRKCHNHFVKCFTRRWLLANPVHIRFRGRKAV